MSLSQVLWMTTVAFRHPCQAVLSLWLVTQARVSSTAGRRGRLTSGGGSALAALPHRNRLSTLTKCGLLVVACFHYTESFCIGTAS